jgi:hypothetical protein
LSQSFSIRQFIPLKFPFQVKDLILDNTHATQIEGLTDDYTALESLSLINVGLTSLKGCPKLPNLQKVRGYFNIIGVIFVPLIVLECT